MTLNFLKNAAPALTRHETYNHFSKIKPKKKACRSTNANLKHVKKISLKIVNKNGFKGKFMETSWGEKIVGYKEYTSTEAVSIDSFQTLDSTDEKHIVAFDESEPSLQIFAKVSRENAKQHLAQSSNIQDTRKFAKEIVPAKSVVVRGKKCTSINNGTNKELEETAVHIVEEMQYSLSPMAKFFYLEMIVMTKGVKQTTLNSIGNHATAFSIGLFTRLTVIAPTDVSEDEVVYYFVSPTYGIKVPLSGDTLLFNPLVYHISLNPKFEGCYIMSVYVSHKTVLRANPL
eukprot:jgi/Psemu1/21958/gm1.21958_g